MLRGGGEGLGREGALGKKGMGKGTGLLDRESCTDTGISVVRPVAHFLGFGNHYFGKIQVIVSQSGAFSQGVLRFWGSFPA